MTLTTENILLFGSILLFVAIVASKTSFKLGVPSLVLFLGVGILAGSEGLGGIYFDDPSIAEFLGKIALVFILFSGGLDTRWKSVKPIISQGILLSTIGVVITTAVAGTAAYLLTDFTLIEALLMGAIISSTDAAAVFSVLREKKLKLKGNLQGLLEFESGTNDPIAYFLTITLTALLLEPEHNLWLVAPKFVMQMAIGGLSGFGLGKAITWALNKLKLEADGLYPVLLITLALFTFAFTDVIGGSGFLAVYFAGVMVGNSDFIHKKSLIKFFDGQAWLMQIIMFLTLGLLVFPSKIPPVIGEGLLMSAVLIFLARPVAVFLILSWFKVSPREMFFISWVGLRGAVPIIFATHPLIMGTPAADKIFYLVFFITITSITLQGTTLAFFAKLFDVIDKTKEMLSKQREIMEDSSTLFAEFELPKDCSSAGKAIVELGLPEESLIALIKRNGNYIMPRGTTVIEEGDIMFMLSDNADTLQKAKAALGTILTEPVES